MNNSGRPPAFETPEDLQKAIDQYFREGITEKEIIVGPKDNKAVIKIPVPTISGLCYYIGFESRQSFYDYEKKPGFTYTVKKARTFIEQYYEEQLSIGNTTGAIFALKNMGWIDRHDLTTDGKAITQPADLSKYTYEQLLELSKGSTDGGDKGTGEA